MDCLERAPSLVDIELKTMILKKIILTTITACTAFWGTSSMSLATEMPAHELLINKVDAAGGLRQAQEQAMSEGRRLAEQCVLCHGIDGNKSAPSMGLQVPNLASQQPLYLLKQLRNFASNRRKQPTMHRI